jgi:AraC-like DNA-binding protein
MPGDELIKGQLVSASFMGHDHVEAFRETYGRTVMKLDIEPLPGHDFELDFRIRSFAGFGMAAGRLSPTRNRHVSAMSEDDDIVLVHAARGCGTLAQLGREVAIADGEATFLTNGISGTFYGHVPSRLANFRFSRAMLNMLTGDIEAALVRRIPREGDVLRLLAGYAAVIDDETALGTPELRRAVAQHMHDLAAILLGPSREGGEIAERRGLKAARLKALKDDIAANLILRDLSLDWLARRHGLSKRSIRALFGGEQTTFADHVRDQRLARVHRALTDPRFAGRTISAIAFDSGFGDLSYFNHAFRRRYDATPSDIRDGTE